MKNSNGVTQLETQLKQWGISQRALPQNNEALKHRLLAGFNPAANNHQAANRLPWMSVSFAALAVVVFVLSAFQSVPKQVAFNAPKTQTVQNLNNDVPAMVGLGAGPQAAEQHQSAPSNGAMVESPQAKTFGGPATMPYLYNPEVPIADNRELIKTSYSAAVQARNVQQTSAAAQTIIRGFKGRVDDFSSSENSAYISFSLPQEKLDQFRLELKNLVGARFIVESTQGENMLPQKQNLEQQNVDAQKQLSQLTADSSQLTAKHNQTISSLKGQLATAKKELAELESRQTFAYEPRIDELKTLIKSLNAQIANENNSYQASFAYMEQQTKAQNDYVAEIQKQDSNLMASVATAQGIISFSHINWLEFVDAYISLYWFGVMFLAGALAAYYYHRRINI